MTFRLTKKRGRKEKKERKKWVQKEKERKRQPGERIGRKECIHTIRPIVKWYLCCQYYIIVHSNTGDILHVNYYL
jgi:hypothetical protein